MRSFAHLWQQDELSDVDIVLTGPHDSNSREDEACKLVPFPGHSVLLSDSPFFKAQILRWQNKRQEDEDVATEADQAAAASTQRRGCSSTARGQKQKKHKVAQQQEQHAEAANTSGPATNSSRRPQLVLTLEHADQQPAALVVLQALYGVKPLPELLSGLQQEQQLQAVVLADMWQVPDVGTAAATMLAEAADGQLSEAVTESLMATQAWPVCLQAFAKKVLLSVFGDLEAVWADEGLQAQLLGLQLHAMELLLSCDELKVASEDTVLYTVRRYAGTKGCLSALQLTPLIRCPQLSLYWLAALAASRDPGLQAISQMLPLLSALPMARIFKSDRQLTARDMEKPFHGAPASWTLPRRATDTVSSVQLIWDLPIDELRQQVQRSIADNRITSMASPRMTAQLSGVRFSIEMQCVPQDSSCRVGMYASVHDLLVDTSICFQARAHIPGSQLDHTLWCPVTTSKVAGWGWGDFFGLPANAGGWDEEAWKAKGLPPHGTLPITLTVYGMSQHHTAPLL